VEKRLRSVSATLRGAFINGVKKEEKWRYKSNNSPKILKR
jgi:hypothetical protein